MEDARSIIQKGEELFSIITTFDFCKIRTKFGSQLIIVFVHHLKYRSWYRFVDIGKKNKKEKDPRNLESSIYISGNNHNRRINILVNKY